MSLSSKSQSTSEGDIWTEAELVDQLNDLLSSLNLPLSLISPADLTPSLLMAILESLLGAKIPLLQEFDLHSTNSIRELKVQQMKIFLGVLETDIAQSDVGLSAVDPRKLADGDWDEVCFVGQILCCVGRHEGLIPAHGHPLPPMTPPRQTASYQRFRAREAQSFKHPLSPHSLSDIETKSFSQTDTPTPCARTPNVIPQFLAEVAEDGSENDQSTPNTSILSELNLPSPANHTHEQDRCNHSLLFSRPNKFSDEASFDGNTSHSFCFCPPEVADRLPVEHDHPESQHRLPISRSGYLHPAEEDEELASFQSTKSFLRTFVPSPEKDTTIRRATIRSQYTKTLQLLNERARLLNQLAGLKTTG